MNKQFKIHKTQVDGIVSYLKDQPYNETAEGIKHLESVLGLADEQGWCQIGGQLVDALMNYLGSKPYRLVDTLVNGLFSLREVADKPEQPHQNEE